MRVVIVTSLPMFSVRDVAMGYANGFMQLGHEVILYDWGRIHATLLRLMSGAPAIPSRDVVTAQSFSGFMDCVLMAEPELVLVFGGCELPVNRIDRLKRLGVKTAVYLTDEPYDVGVTSEVAPHYDYVFLNDPSTLAIHEKASKAHYLPVGFDPTVRKNLPEIKPDQYDVLFVGTLTKERAELFDSMSDYLSALKFRIAGFPVLDSEAFAKQWQVPEESWVLSQMVEQSSVTLQSGLRLTGLYNASAITVNPHRDSRWVHNVTSDGSSSEIRATSPNPRTFEVPACGGFQLCSDDRTEVTRMFEEGSEIVLYSDAKDLKAKIEYYLAHPKEAAEIADRACKKVWDRDTYTHRVKEMISVITSDTGGEKDVAGTEG